MGTTKGVLAPKTANLESFSCIWLDQDVHVTEDNQQTLHELRSIINYLQLFDNSDECEQHIRKITKEKVILLVSGRLGRKIIPAIHDLPQFLASYIFCQDLKANKEWSSKYAKVKGVFNVRADLVAALASDQKGRGKMEDGGCISILNRGSGSIQERNAVFMWFQLFVEVLLRMHHKTSDRKELIDLCKKTYEGNNQEMDIILQFEKEYKPDKAIWWYTRESCFYRMMNKALRVQDYDTLLALRFLITDIAKQIKQEHDNFIRTHVSRDIIHVYRGQLISHDELELMKKSVGEYLSMNSFLSTSRDRTIAVKFAQNGSIYHNMHQIMLEIDIDPRSETKAFADVTKLSYFEAEGEVLLMLGSLFRIEKVTEDKKERMWIAKLSLASEGDFELKETFAHMKEKIGDDTDLDSLGKILLQMGEYEQAKKVYVRMFRTTRLALSTVHAGLGQACKFQKNYADSLEHHETSLNILREQLGEESDEVSMSYNYIAQVHWWKGNYKEALVNNQKAMAIQEKLVPAKPLSLAKIYHVVATLYDCLGNNESALKYYEKALTIRKSVLPSDHPDIALTYNNLGCFYRDIGDNRKAREHYQKSLEISRKVLPPNHPEILRTETNIKELEKSSKD